MSKDIHQRIAVVLEARTDKDGYDHIVVVGAFDDESKIPSEADAAKLYGTCFARTTVNVFLNMNQGAPGFGIGEHRYAEPEDGTEEG